MTLLVTAVTLDPQCCLLSLGNTLWWRTLWLRVCFLWLHWPHKCPRVHIYGNQYSLRQTLGNYWHHSISGSHAGL